MGHRFHPDIYRDIGSRSGITNERSIDHDDLLPYLISRLRSIHLPMTLALVRFDERGAKLAERITGPAFVPFGYVDALPNGDIAVLCIGIGDWIEHEITNTLMDELALIAHEVMQSNCTLAFMHFWSDEVGGVCDIDTLVDMPMEKTVEIDFSSSIRGVA